MFGLNEIAQLLGQVVTLLTDMLREIREMSVKLDRMRLTPAPKKGSKDADE